MTLIIACIALVAFFWGGWPLVARAAGESDPYQPLVLCVAAVIPIATYTALTASTSFPTGLKLLTLVAAGLMMGLGLIAFGIVAGSPLIDTAISIPIINTSMLLVTVIGAIIFFREDINPQKVAGITILVIGIFVIGRA